MIRVSDNSVQSAPLDHDDADDVIVVVKNIICEWEKVLNFSYFHLW